MTDFQDGTIGFYGVAWHEAGHVWGINHSGRYDSHEANPPTMSTCSYPSNGWERANLSQDDEAAVQFLDDYDGTYRSATANSSFEEGTQWWGKSSQAGSLSTSTSGGGADGSISYGFFKSNGTSSYIFSTTRYIKAWEAEVKSRAQYRKYETDDVGTLLVVGAWRKVSYAVDSDECWDKINGTRYKLSAPSVDDAFGDHWYTNTCWPSSNWGSCTTGVSDVSTGQTPIAMDVRVYVYNRMQDYTNGPWTRIKVDRTRVMIND